MFTLQLVELCFFILVWMGIDSVYTPASRTECIYFYMDWSVRCSVELGVFYSYMDGSGWFLLTCWSESGGFYSHAGMNGFLLALMPVEVGGFYCHASEIGAI